MKITLVQSAAAIQDPKVNFFKARMRINNVDSDIFVFPEMFCSGYTGDRERMSVDMMEPKVVSELSALSVNRGCAIICGCPRERGGRIYNTALLIDGRKVTEYRKMVLSTDGVFDETEVFAAGDRPMIIDHQGLRIGVMIGTDLESVELYRLYADNGADIVICISAFIESQMDRFEKIMAARAAEFSLPLMICNMAGTDPGQRMIGRSRYIGPDGDAVETLSESSDLREIKVDIERIREGNAKRSLNPVLRFGRIIAAESHSGEGADPVPRCPITGKPL